MPPVIRLMYAMEVQLVAPPIKLPMERVAGVAQAVVEAAAPIVKQRDKPVVQLLAVEEAKRRIAMALFVTAMRVLRVVPGPIPIARAMIPVIVEIVPHQEQPRARARFVKQTRSR